MSSTLLAPVRSNQTVEVAAGQACAAPTVQNPNSIFSLTTAAEWGQASSRQLGQFQRFTASVLRTRFGLVDPDVVASVANDAFMKIERYLDPTKLGEGGVQAFAARVIKTVAISSNRKAQAPLKPESSFTGSAMDSEHASFTAGVVDHRESGPFASASFGEMTTSVGKVIRSLAPELQETANLLMAGEAPAEIARQTGQTRAVARRRVEKIEYSLEARLSDYRQRIE